MIVLRKSNHGMGDLKGQFAPKHELLLYCSKGQHILNFEDGREPDVWDVPVKFTGSIRLHPNEKPVSWYSNPIKFSCPVDGIVCDPFIGSGTCAEAARQLGRNFIGGDIDNQWVEVSKKRLGIT